MEIAVVIANFQKYEQTVKCLTGLLKFMPANLTKHIVLVDNQSTKAIDIIKKKFPQIKIIKNKNNLGFAGAVNLGVEGFLKNKTTHILILNNDTVINSDFITPLVNSNYDLVSPILKFKRTGEWIYDLGGKVNWLIGRPFHFELKESLTQSLAAEKLKLDYVSGCCLLIKREVFDKIGLFDERFFLYFEDVDFCLRAKNQGFKIKVMTKSILIHQLEEKKVAARLFKLKQLLKSQKYFIDKWVGLFSRPLAYVYYTWLKFKINV